MSLVNTYLIKTATLIALIGASFQMQSLADTISAPLTVTGRLDVQGAYAPVSANGIRYYKQAEINPPKYHIPAGVTEDGYRIGFAVQGYVYSADFAGTLKTQYGAWIRTGSSSANPTGSIINSYGLYLENLASSNVDIQNSFGLFQSSSWARNYFAGNVGVGTTDPGSFLPSWINPDSPSILEVESSADSRDSILALTRPTKNAGLWVWHDGNATNSYIDHGSVSDLQGLHIRGKVTSSPFEIASFMNSGNVGIGTTTPGNKLEVNGTIRSKEVIVESTGWPDYVFEDGYALPSLAEVEAHIEEKGHLPGAEAASTVNEGGQSLGAMQRQMMQKIEELTLYMIDQNKEKTAMREEMSSLKLELQKLKALVEL